MDSFEHNAFKHMMNEVVDYGSCCECGACVLACPHNVIGPCIQGSPNVFVNSLPAMRKGDQGVHAACCDGNVWNSNAGSGTGFINGKPATRKGDATKHCGGSGTVQVGSGNVNTGG